MIRSFTSGYWARKEDCKKQNYIYTKHQQHQHQPDTICHYSQKVPEIQVKGRLQIINCYHNLLSCWRDFIVTLKVFLLSLQGPCRIHIEMFLLDVRHVGINV